MGGGLGAHARRAGGAEGVQGCAEGRCRLVDREGPRASSRVSHCSAVSINQGGAFGCLVCARGEEEGVCALFGEGRAPARTRLFRTRKELRHRIECQKKKKKKKKKKKS